MTLAPLPERRELVRWLFAEATNALEAAQTVASRGQSPRLERAQYQRCAEQVISTIKDVEILASAVRVVLNPAIVPEDRPAESS